MWGCLMNPHEHSRTSKTCRRTHRSTCGSPRLGTRRAAALYLLGSLVLSLICGCGSHNNDNAMADSFYLDPSKDLHKLGRVALVELDNMAAYPEISKDVTEAIFRATQKKQVFGVMVVRQNDPAWRSLIENLDTLQALQQLQTMRETLKCNGLLLGSVTEYQPYPHMVIGLRLKLLDLTDGQLLWGLEQVWDCADKSIQKRIQGYFKRELRSGYAPLREELVTVSSLNFCKFVAYEIAQTFSGPEQ